MNIYHFQPSLDRELVYQCCSSFLAGEGGVQTYIKSLLSSREPNLSNHVINSLAGVNQTQFKLLHLHDEGMVSQITGDCPSVFTSHNHTAHCPSGTKYLRTYGLPCERSISVMGCTWGHMIDGCGSRRPRNIIHKILNSYKLLEKLKQLEIPIIANSDYMRAQLIKTGLPPEQVMTLRCGSPMPKISTAPLTQGIHKNQRILFAGRIVPDKGLEWLLKALVKTAPIIQLDIAGDGWHRSQMEKLVKQLGLNNRVTWHGWCDPEKVEALYQQCFAVIFPSVWAEPAGLVTLEAYAHYRPIIASVAGGIPEHVHNQGTGMLVSLNNIDQLASAITELSTNYKKSRCLGEQGHALFLKEFTMHIHIQRLKRIYEKTIDNFDSKHNK